MTDKLNELADFLGDQIGRLKSIQIKNKTLAEIQAEVDAEFEKENRQYTQSEYDNFTIYKMAQKIVELEKIIQDRAQ